MNKVNIQDLRDHIQYDPITGRMWWRRRMSNACPAGKPALSARKDSGHLAGFFRGTPLQAHRVAWAIHYGEWPAGCIDHINGVRDDNRIVNLRDVSRAGNARNRRPNRGKASGLPHGVSVKANGRFFAQIQSGKKNYHLGYFGSVEEAHAAYLNARDRFGFHVNHGRILRALEAQEDA